MTDPKQMPDLLPCPFCGGDNLTLNETDCGCIAVFCGGREAEEDGEWKHVCGFAGPDVPSLSGDNEAIRAWNRRADLVPTVDVDALSDAIDLAREHLASERLVLVDGLLFDLRRILTEHLGGESDD